MNEVILVAIWGGARGQAGLLTPSHFRFFLPFFSVEWSSRLFAACGIARQHKDRASSWAFTGAMTKRDDPMYK